MRRIGVILAAGRGRRMGSTKQLVPWPAEGGAKSLVAAAFDAVRPICHEMVVVLGHEAAAVAAALSDRAFERVEIDPDLPMFESIRAGLRAAQRRDPAADVVLQPGDHPEVSDATRNILIAESNRHPRQAVIPQFAGRGGHPIIVPPSIVSLLVAADCPAGLGAFWTQHPELCRRIAVEDGAVVRDIDTPDDLVP